MHHSSRFSDALRVHLHGYQCVYCGEPASTREHFPPATYSIWGFILPACGECNNLAGTFSPIDWDVRVDRVKNSLRRRGNSLLLTPDWSEDEKAELGLVLKGEITRWQSRKNRLQERLAWSVDSYIALIDRSRIFAKNPVVSDFTTEIENQLSTSIEPTPSIEPIVRKPPKHQQKRYPADKLPVSLSRNRRKF